MVVASDIYIPCYNIARFCQLVKKKYTMKNIWEPLKTMFLEVGVWGEAPHIALFLFAEKQKGRFLEMSIYESDRIIMHLFTIKQGKYSCRYLYHSYGEVALVTIRVYRRSGYSPSCGSPANAADISPGGSTRFTPQRNSRLVSSSRSEASQISPAVCK